MLEQLRPAIVSLAIFTVLTGVAYPLAVTGIAQVAFPKQANGSVIPGKSPSAGSELIGQSFTNPRYFWSRPSATSPVPYNAAASSGSNLGPLNSDLKKQVRDRVAALRAADPANTSPIPMDLVTSSGSGLDPHISIAAARYQAPRIARIHGLSLNAVNNLIADHTIRRQFGVLGEPVVNVLQSNIALDQGIAGKAAR